MAANKISEAYVQAERAKFAPQASVESGRNEQIARCMYELETMRAGMAAERQDRKWMWQLGELDWLEELHRLLYDWRQMKNKIALCSLGALGLITSDTKQDVTYLLCNLCRAYRAAQFWAALPLNDHHENCECQRGMAYVGIHLTDKFVAIGSPWSSRNPKVVGELAEAPSGFVVRGHGYSMADLRPAGYMCGNIHRNERETVTVHASDVGDVSEMLSPAEVRMIEEPGIR